jgi:hypothetical protein
MCSFHYGNSGTRIATAAQMCNKKRKDPSSAVKVKNSTIGTADKTIE